MYINKLLFIIPSLYFFKTRFVINLNFFLQYLLEIGFALFIFFFFNSLSFEIVILFFYHYLAFISLYEIGYFVNDTIAVKYENKPNKRLKKFNSKLYLLFFVLIRLVFFVFITLHLEYENNNLWLIFYLFLLIVFSLYNFLNKTYYRCITFQMLVFLRFMAPFFIILDYYYLFLIGNLVALTYVPYRTLGYIKSKKLAYEKIKRDLNSKLLAFIVPILFFLLIIIFQKV